MQYDNTRAPIGSTNHTYLLTTITQWLLLATAGTFGAMFAYNTLSPISSFLAALVAVAVIGLNFAEGYLVRFAVASWRFGFGKMAFLAGLGACAISAYSLLAGYNVVSSYLLQNQQQALATDYDIAAAKQRIRAAETQSFRSLDFGNARSDYLTTAAAENEKIATLLRNKPANNSSVSPSTAATFVAIALEAAIIGLTAFIELFQRPTPLPALVKFNDKLVEWGLDDEQLQHLKISASPSAGTVSLPDSKTPSERVRTRVSAVEVVQAEVVEDHFQAWLKLLTNQQLKPTVKDTKRYLRSCGQSMELAQVTAGEYLERGYNLGYLDLNTKTDAFSSQYVLANQKLLGQGGANHVT